MNLMKKVISLIIVCTVLSGFSMTVCADKIYETSKHDTSVGIAGANMEDLEYKVTTKLSYLCGGDVGVYLYTTSVGLQSSFVKSTSRTVTTEMREYDSSTKYTNARTRKGTFGMVNGYYRPKMWGYTYTNPGTVESDSTAEFRLYWKVQEISGDTSTSIPKGLLRYSFWCYT